MLVLHAAICINVFKNTENRLARLESIFATSILWPQGILRRIFNVLKKSTNKFDCLIYEMFFIQELRPALSVQSDSIRAKVFN